MLKTHVFHNQATSVSKGIFFDNKEGFNTLLVSIKGNPTSFKIDFKFMNACGDIETLQGLKCADWSIGTSTTTSNQSWIFDISNMKRVHMDLSAITPGAGNLTVIGEAGY